MPTGAVEAPLLIGQGEADTLITPAAQEAYVTGRCADGQQVDYRTSADRDHLSVVAADSPAMDELPGLDAGAAVGGAGEGHLRALISDAALARCPWRSAGLRRDPPR